MIFHSLQIALLVLFIHATTWEGNIMSWVKVFNFPEWIEKPLYGCPMCMTPWWGTLIYFTLLNLPINFQVYLLTIGSACGMSVLSVIAIYAKNYFKKNTPEDDD